MLTLSYGYEQPETDDTGDIWFPAMERNITKLNDHTHNGTNSALIPPTTQSILAASWSADLGGGKYSQVVTLPGALTFDTISIQIRLSSGHVIYPTLEKTSSSTYTLYVNDNTLNLTAVYSS